MTNNAQPNDGRADIERAVQQLAERLPAPLAPLARLAFNYRWSWLSGGTDVFEHIEPRLWRHSQCNPRDILEAVTPEGLRQLSGDAAFVARVRTLAEACTAALEQPAALTRIPRDRPVAYFCAEFGFHCSMPIRWARNLPPSIWI